MDVRPGTVFGGGRYEIRTLLGRGGMGSVYLAHDRVLDEPVAIKVLRADVAHERHLADRFRSEIKLARRVRHRNVCAIHDYGEDGGLLFISMEYVAGVDLRRLLQDRGGLPEAQACDVVLQVAEGLQAVHEAGIVHRDLKTANVMMDAQGTARLMDFGIAKRVGGEALTAAGQIVGTPEYMSPEQARGEAVDGRSDLYALGVLAYEVFTGHVPFQGETPVATILKHLREPPPLDGPAAAGIPLALRDVLRRALAKQPADRHASARELTEAFRSARFADARPQDVATEVLDVPAPRRRAPPRVAPFVLLVALALGGALLWRLQRHGPALAPSAMPPASIPRQPPPSSTDLPVPQTAAPLPPAPAPAPRSAARRRRPLATPAPAAMPSLPVAIPAPPPTTVPAVVPAPPAAPGLLQLAVLPWGEVAVDGVVVGSTPLEKLTLAAGPHTLRIRHPAFGVVQRTVVIRSGQVEKVFIDLAR